MNMRAPTLSVVIPCHNSAAVLPATVHSAIGQSFDDIEIIIVDDGSADTTLAVANALAQSDARISVISQSNAGVSAARNRGIAAARGEFIALLDSDDLWDRDHLAVHVGRLRADPSLGLSFCAVRFIDPDGRESGERTRPQLDGLTPADVLYTNPCSTCSAIIFRKAILADAGGFLETLRRAEDQEWLFRIALTHWRMAGVDRPTVAYRTSPGGLSANLEGMYEGFCEMLKQARRSDPALVDLHGPRAAARMSRYLARRALRLQLDGWVARRFIARALRAAPDMLLTEPRQTIATALASLVPGFGTFLFRVLKRA